MLSMWFLQRCWNGTFCHNLRVSSKSLLFVDANPTRLWSSTCRNYSGLRRKKLSEKVDRVLEFLRDKQSNLKSGGVYKKRDSLRLQRDKICSFCEGEVIDDIAMGLNSKPVDLNTIQRELAFIENTVYSVECAQATLQDVKELIIMGDTANDEEIIIECEASFCMIVNELKRKSVQEFMHRLRTGDEESNPYESNGLLLNELNCFVQIQAGAGGDDACDWVRMLKAMYIGWCNEHSEYAYEIVDENFADGCVEGIVENKKDHNHILRSVTLKITSRSNYSSSSSTYPYGWFKMEAGVHRLIRISPFDPFNKRHTAFASVSVYPHFEEEHLRRLIEGASEQSQSNASNVQYSRSPGSASTAKFCGGRKRRNSERNDQNASCINSILNSMMSNDIKVETFRSSGPGGQGVNKTDSAVRMTHVPTGTVVQCQNERSQHLNKTTATSMLRSKLLGQLKQREARVTSASVIGNDGRNSFGGRHARSVTLQPYALVKDHRTNWQVDGSGNVERYLTGKGNALMSAMESHVGDAFYLNTL